MTNPISTSNANPLVTTSGAIIGGTFYAELIQVLFDLRWLVLFIIALVFTDFCSGLTASVKNKKETATRQTREAVKCSNKSLHMVA